MADQDPKHELDQMMFGAAAVGLCIVRVLAESDSTMGKRIAEEAEKMEVHLDQNDCTRAAQIISHFRLALAHPEKTPLLTPSD